MMPASIKAFATLMYVGVVCYALFNFHLSRDIGFRLGQNIVGNNPDAIIPIIYAVLGAISLATYFTAWQRSKVARWSLLIFIALYLSLILVFIYMLLSYYSRLGGYILHMPATINFPQLLIAISHFSLFAAMCLLFSRSAKGWFRESDVKMTSPAHSLADDDQRSGGVENSFDLERPSAFHFDANQWNAAIANDERVALIAEKLLPLGQKRVDEFKFSYLRLNDKSALPDLVRRIIADARRDSDQS